VSAAHRRPAEDGTVSAGPPGRGLAVDPQDPAPGGGGKMPTGRAWPPRESGSLRPQKRTVAAAWAPEGGTGARAAWPWLRQSPSLRAA